jgi:hypothetical protein
MAAVKFVHAFEDVAVVLMCAAELGMTIQVDAPTEGPEQDTVSIVDLNKLGHGVFLLYRPEWVFGTPEFAKISAGRNRGKYFQKPRVNFAPITVSFGGERVESGVTRLGSGTLSVHTNWLNSFDQTLQPTPDAVRSAYDIVKKKIDTRKRLRGGGQIFMVLEYASKKLNSRTALPPFDYLRSSD